MSDVTQENLDLSAELLKEWTLGERSGDTAQVVVKEDSEQYIKEAERRGVPRENLEILRTLNSDFLPAGLHAVGQLAIPAMAQDPDLKRVTLKLPTVGNDSFNFVFDRSRQVPAGAAGSNEGMKTKYGTGSVSVDMYATGNRGQMAAVKGRLSAQATEAYGEK